MVAMILAEATCSSNEVGMTVQNNIQTRVVRMAAKVKVRPEFYIVLCPWSLKSSSCIIETAEYHIAKIFRGSKLSQIGGKMGFRGKNFSELLARIYRLLSTEPSKNRGENFH